MYKEAQRLVSGEHLSSIEKNCLEKLIRGGIEFKTDEAKYYGEEFLGVYGFDKNSIKSAHIRRISTQITSGFLEDAKLENIVRNEYPISLIEHHSKDDENKLLFIKSVYDEYMSNIIDKTGYSGFLKALNIQTKWGYLVYLFWRYPTNQHRCFLNTRRNEVTVDKWCYNGFKFTIEEVYISFMFRKNWRLMALADTNKNTHFYKINTKTGDIVSMCNTDFITYDLSSLLSRVRAYI